MFVSPTPPQPVKKQIANDHTPTSLEAEEKGLVEEGL